MTALTSCSPGTSNARQAEIRVPRSQRLQRDGEQSERYGPKGLRLGDPGGLVPSQNRGKLRIRLGSSVR